MVTIPALATGAGVTDTTLFETAEGNPQSNKESGLAIFNYVLSKLALATNSVFGLVKGDGTTVTITAGIASAVAQATPVTADETGGTYTFALTDANKFIPFNLGSPQSAVIPASGSVPFPVGTTLGIWQKGAGVVGVSGAGGVTVLSAGSLFHTNGQNAVAQVIQVASNVWVLYGNLVT